MANSRRVYQIAEKIREKVAAWLIIDGDSRFFLVTVTSVVVSSDLRHAKIYWVVSGDEARRESVERSFKQTERIIRHALAQDLGVRFVPELRFYYDDTFDQKEKVDRLLAKVAEERMARQVLNKEAVDEE
jgi:ribosome-binding factor A